MIKKDTAGTNGMEAAAWGLRNRCCSRGVPLTVPVLYLSLLANGWGGQGRSGLSRL